MPAFQDITGTKINHLTALSATDKRECGSVVWLWKCDCGKETFARAAQVRNGHIKSCGCLFHKEHRERTSPQICRHCGGESTRILPSGFYAGVCDKCANKQGNDSRDDLVRLVGSAKVRAKKIGVPFDLRPEDLEIPEFCPILGIKMERGTLDNRESSPSLDRMKPELGYVKGNVNVISFLANRIKNTGTADEHRRIADWMDTQKQEAA